MSVSLAEFCTIADRLWPPDGAEEWDAPGLVCGDPAAEVSSVLLAVDAVPATVEEATAGSHDLLLTHHPLLLRGVKSIAEDRYKGRVLAAAIRGGLAILAAHTNADIVRSGTSAVLAAVLGLEDTRPILPAHGPEPRASGLGRVGRLPSAEGLRHLATRLARALPATAGGVRVAGEPEAQIRVVSLCAGAGDSLLSEPAVLASDVYITSDLRHHPASEAREQARLAGGPALIDVSHWAAESLWLAGAAEELRRAVPGLRVAVSTLRTDPWDFTVESGGQRR
ncbi:MAG TPA: Nif3-like dinuclear metal center hexameric protein [Microbacteriaceae bacterium]|nr:Nif3-like dinuclear metal center hexameric protein [Microbacteriaceae bacterium]